MRWSKASLLIALTGLAACSPPPQKSAQASNPAPAPIRPIGSQPVKCREILSVQQEVDRGRGCTRSRKPRQGFARKNQIGSIGLPEMSALRMGLKLQLLDPALSIFRQRSLVAMVFGIRLGIIALIKRSLREFFRAYSQLRRVLRLDLQYARARAFPW